MRALLALIALAIGASAQTTVINGAGGGGAPSGSAGGDLSGTYPNPAVAKINGTSFSGLSTGLLKNTTSTGVPSIAGVTDVTGLFSGTCTSSTLLGGDGVCKTVSSAFTGVTTGTNSTAAMTVGTGASLTFSGSGTINANQISGAAPAPSATTDTTTATNISTGTLSNARLGLPFNFSSNILGVGPTAYTPTGTLEVYDASASSGATKVVVRMATGQSASNLLEVQNASGTPFAWVDTSGQIVSNNLVTGVLGFNLNNSNTALRPRSSDNALRIHTVAGATTQSTGLYGWVPSSDTTAASDTGVARNAAGVVEVNNGTIGTIRDLKVRHLIKAGTAPTISSGFGTSPSLAGADGAGRLTVGRGGSAATGVIAFGTAFTTAPACVANNETTIVLVQAAATTTTLTLTSSSAWSAADKLTWVCNAY